MGTSLHDSVVGEGPDVVLLHGLFAQGSNLGMIARGLQEEFRVHSPDLPDHGRSEWSGSPSIATYAEAISEWMEDHHLYSAHFVGHSLGGKVAMQLALNEPSRVDKLVVADIAPGGLPPGSRRCFCWYGGRCASQLRFPAGGGQGAGGACYRGGRYPVLAAEPHAYPGWTLHLAAESGRVGSGLC
jgi:pimeloyl-ACP methyl ester carboxylesterase